VKFAQQTSPQNPPRMADFEELTSSSALWYRQSMLSAGLGSGVTPGETFAITPEIPSNGPVTPYIAKNYTPPPDGFTRNYRRVSSFPYRIRSFTRRKSSFPREKSSFTSEKSSFNCYKSSANREKSSANCEKSSANCYKSSVNLYKSSVNREKSSANPYKSSANREKNSVNPAKGTNRSPGSLFQTRSGSEQSRNIRHGGYLWHRIIFL
jgi:hypothetical protein